MSTYTFEEIHPFVLTDGRRFASLACAGQSAELIKEDVQVKHARTGMVYSKQEASKAYHDRSSAEWQSIHDASRAYVEPGFRSFRGRE